ncbi:MAG: hypothetical protein EHM85_02670 [Desulfobacteraceae bacterium]|nr:MAG: hypothetical protein EHM85_02670 [Desulfobacteraceae bacterium]
MTNCIRPLRKSGPKHASASLNPKSVTDHFVGYIFFLHRIAFLAADGGSSPVRLPAGRQRSVHPVHPI